MITFKKYFKAEKKKYPNALCCKTKDAPKKHPVGSQLDPDSVNKWIKRREKNSRSEPLNNIQKLAVFMPAIQSIFGSSNKYDS